MSGNLFIPKIKQHAESVMSAPSVAQSETGEKKHGTLQVIVQWLVVALFFLLPIFFTPHLWASLGFDKIVLTMGIGITVLVLLSFQVLRLRQMATVIPLPLMLYGVLLIAGIASAFLSGDVRGALRGSVMEPQTIASLATIGLAMFLPLVLQRSKSMMLATLSALGLSTVVLFLYNLSRLFLGPAFLSFQTFNALPISPIGLFNDLAIFSAVVVLFSLITLLQVRLKPLLQYVFAGMTVLALGLLVVINFFNVWLIIGFFAFLVLMYLLARDTIFAGEETRPLENSTVLFTTTTLVCVVSVLFIIAGDFFGDKVNAFTQVNFSEVRPSLTATLDIARAVYSDNALLGAGPNNFAEAWRLHKNPVINQTNFWDTIFDGGNGFVPTLFINLGLLGGFCLILVHVSYLYLGYKMLLRTRHFDPFWYYIGVVSFAGACFIWGVSYMYAPGTAILLLGALFMGCTFAASGVLLPDLVKTIPLTTNRQRGFLLMAGVICVVVIGVSTLFSVGTQYVAQSSFVKSAAQADRGEISVAEFEQAVPYAYGLYPDDRFLVSLAQIKMQNLNIMLQIPEPTEEDARRFRDEASQAISLLSEALLTGAGNPNYHALQAGIYSNLVLAGVSEAQERSEAALSEAMRLDPQNPGYHLIAAQLAARIGDKDKAREEIATALTLKQNFTEALVLSAELDIAEGKTESAISTARTIITFEPRNPALYLQLGLLLVSNQQLPEAEQAFQAAIQLDPQYANARYLLAQIYIYKEQYDAALEQLRIVQKTNTEDTGLAALIVQLESGQYGAIQKPNFTGTVAEQKPNTEFDQTVTVDSPVETSLVTPVNPVTNGSNDETGQVGSEQSSDTVNE